MSRLRYSVDQVEAIRTYKRVLRLVHQYMRRNLDDGTLVAAGGGLMTWGELRQHIQESLKLRVQRP
jgi:hypothetical protein